MSTKADPQRITCEDKFWNKNELMLWLEMHFEYFYFMISWRDNSHEEQLTEQRKFRIIQEGMNCDIFHYFG